MTPLFIKTIFLIGLTLSVTLTQAQSGDEDDPTPTLEIGAQVYTQRCVLCHGSQAMGDGVLPLKLEVYPNTNLRKAIKAKTLEDIRATIIYGGAHADISMYMPPFGKELTWTELESVTRFVDLIRDNTTAAIQLVEQSMGIEENSLHAGQRIYETRCVLCHGASGEGDGRMSKLLKSPPPANLRNSRLPDDYMLKIIREGGEGVGRSKHMPPWKDQLNTREINNVIVYLKSIRS